MRIGSRDVRRVDALNQRSNLVAKTHNPKVVSSNLTPATNSEFRNNGLGGSTPEPFSFLGVIQGDA